MKDMYLVDYSVKGIKTLDQTVSLSFYKKTITRDLNTQDYNVKGIYGMNGAGKSAIVESVKILKNIIVNSSYLNNPINQKSLDAIINKKLEQLDLGADFLVSFKDELILFRYQVTLTKDVLGKYSITKETLAEKDATSRKEDMNSILIIENGEITYIYENSEKKYGDLLRDRTKNLLTTASISSLFIEKIWTTKKSVQNSIIDKLCRDLMLLFIFGHKLYIYMDQADNHTEYLISKMRKLLPGEKSESGIFETMIGDYLEMNQGQINILTASPIGVPKEMYGGFKRSVEQLQDFLCIFKYDLKKVEIDKKDDGEVYICSLVMVYDSYRVNAEFESTGIKKLINLFMYIKEMVQGNIVFIDEFDSNLHDVYLCALLEYLMEYGEGQLCFTTHNVGPMDILRKHRKSIDFLSMDHKIYSWIRNGNYSPAKLYRNGMIEGSPFNVDSIDFIGIFDSFEEDD